MLRKLDGTIVGIKVKSGTATRTPQQKLIDNELINSEGLNTVGDRATHIGGDYQLHIGILVKLIMLLRY